MSLHEAERDRKQLEEVVLVLARAVSKRMGAARGIFQWDTVNSVSLL